MILWQQGSCFNNEMHGVVFCRRIATTKLVEGGELLMQSNINGEKKTKSNNETDDFAFLKVNIFDHPLIHRNYSLRKYYITALYGLVKNMNSPILGEYINIYLTMLNISEADKTKIMSLTKEEFQYAIKQTIKFHYRKRWSGKNILFADTLFIANFCSEKLSTEQIAEIAKKLKIKKSSTEMIIGFCRSIHENAFDDAKQYYRKALKKDKNVRYIKFLFHRAQNKLISEKTEKFVVAAVGTMGAGKSTFLNALIGRDMFPSRNMACTSKCASIVDNDFLGYNHVIGQSQYDDGRKEYIGVLTKKEIAHWNNNPEIKDIQLECNLQGILNKQKAIILHDTPGTNFSQDSSHRDNTYEFIEKTPLDLIVYLINATNIASDDDYFLLKKISDVISKKPNTEILFIINKFDEYDLEHSDNIAVTLNNLRQDLKEIGFQNPDLIPVSAYAAKLFKMALYGIPLSQKEAIDFEQFFNTFSEETYNLNRYALIEYELPEPTPDIISLILINEKEYLNNQIYSVLRNTGISLVESRLNQLV